MGIRQLLSFLLHPDNAFGNGQAQTAPLSVPRWKWEKKKGGRRFFRDGTCGTPGPWSRT